MAFAERLMAPLAQFRSKLRNPVCDMAQDGVLQTISKPKVKQIEMSAALQNALTIPCPDPTAEERARDAHQMQGLRMARQEDWEGLSNAILKADHARAKTPGGMPIAELLAFGARADVVGAAEHALLTGRPERDAPLLDGIEALEEILAERNTDPVIAAIVAKAHMDIGWAWRGTSWETEVPTRNREAFAAHFDRAADIVAAFDVKRLALSLLASAKCALSAGHGGPVRKIIADYENWIDLDPRDPRALRAMGGHLLPRWHGDYDRLELEARRTAGRTHDIWGAGAYTWVMFDAISTDVEACARLDLDFFLDGLQDIVRQCPDQYTVNLLAAYSVNTMGATPTGHDQADYVRAEISAAAEWIVKDHLTELHPMLWAHAARGFDNALKVRCPDRFAASGYADALRYLTNLFRRELAAGKRVVFTDQGAVTRTA